MLEHTNTWTCLIAASHTVSQEPDTSHYWIYCTSVDNTTSVSCFINKKRDSVKGFLSSYKFRENSSLWKAGRWNKMWYVFIILILFLFKISSTTCCLGGGGGVIYNAFCTQDSGLIFIHHANYGRRDPLTCASILANTSNCFYPQTSNLRSR